LFVSQDRETGRLFVLVIGDLPGGTFLFLEIDSAGAESILRVSPGAGDDRFQKGNSTGRPYFFMLCSRVDDKDVSSRIIDRTRIWNGLGVVQKWWDGYIPWDLLRPVCALQLL